MPPGKKVYGSFQGGLSAPGVLPPLLQLYHHQQPALHQHTLDIFGTCSEHLSKDGWIFRGSRLRAYSVPLSVRFRYPAIQGSWPWKLLL